MKPAEPKQSPDEQEVPRGGRFCDAILATRRFYEERADEYFRRTVSADLSHLYNRFLPYLPSGGHILDLGCGSGRDLHAFIRRGFRAIGIDSSEALVERARAYSAAECVVGRIEELAYDHRFNGVWACASLLHLTRAAIGDALSRIHRSLVLGGVLFASVQEGEGEYVAADGRFYTLYTESEFLSFLKAAGFDVLETWNSQDALESKRPIHWLNVLARTTKGDKGTSS
jgi:SAM-dependent methyltransferase